MVTQEQVVSQVVDVLERLGVRDTDEQREMLARRLVVTEGMTVPDAEAFYEWYASDPRVTGLARAREAATRLKDAASWRGVVKTARRAMADKAKSLPPESERSPQTPRVGFTEMSDAEFRRFDLERQCLYRIIFDSASPAQVSLESGLSEAAVSALLDDPRHADCPSPEAREAYRRRLERRGKPPRGLARRKPAPEAQDEPPPPPAPDPWEARRKEIMARANSLTQADVEEAHREFGKLMSRLADPNARVRKREG